jgi:hypothetical protein
MFHVGQKVECVDDTPGLHGVIPGLTKGRIYEILALGHWGHVSVIPDRFQNPKRFRPLTDTSISDVLSQTAPKDSRKWDNRRKIREKV